MQAIKDCIIVATSRDHDGVDREIFTVVENSALKFLRYMPYHNAVRDHDGKPARYTKDEATRMTVEEARRVIVRELMRRGGRPESFFWVRDLRIVEVLV